MRDVYVRGVATLAAPGGRPAAELLPPRLRRRTSLLTRMVAQALGDLARTCGVDLATAPLVLGSAFGEIDTTIGLLAMMHADDGALSPTRFHNSVHNTACGYVSIATNNRGFATAIAAGPATVAATLLECHGLLATRAPDVVMVVGEEPVPEPFTPQPSYDGLAVALWLAAEPSAAGQPVLRNLRRVPGDEQPAAASSANPCAPALELADACAAARPATIAVGDTWHVDVHPGGA